ncbi:hypothetical protein BS50DRAFT_593865 [Corynespora cassiicola Philippines]|uniref:Uncharacterized protein n=1 Tax=Corynespora cassiicola Philippines TaxID=1448308 RepID=A0A2T2N599_CORCC|nr:hypothetical protein BS50DRAFT_593865 [Corynespora cassiicola Philippines]
MGFRSKLTAITLAQSFTKRLTPSASSSTTEKNERWAKPDKTDKRCLKEAAQKGGRSGLQRSNAVRRQEAKPSPTPKDSSNKEFVIYVNETGLSSPASTNASSKEFVIYVDETGWSQKEERSIDEQPSDGDYFDHYHAV